MHLVTWSWIYSCASHLLSHSSSLRVNADWRWVFCCLRLKAWELEHPIYTSSITKRNLINISVVFHLKGYLVLEYRPFKSNINHEQLDNMLRDGDGTIDFEGKNNDNGGSHSPAAHYIQSLKETSVKQSMGSESWTFIRRCQAFNEWWEWPKPRPHFLLPPLYFYLPASDSYDMGSHGPVIIALPINWNKRNEIWSSIYPAAKFPPSQFCQAHSGLPCSGYLFWHWIILPSSSSTFLEIGLAFCWSTCTPIFQLLLKVFFKPLTNGCD